MYTLMKNLHKSTQYYAEYERMPHIMLVIPRGEAIRNFIYSDTLKQLSKHARITLLSVIHDEQFKARFGHLVENIYHLDRSPDGRVSATLRDTILHSHYRWMWSEKAKNKWEILSHRASKRIDKLRFSIWKVNIRTIANRPCLQGLTKLYQNILSRSKVTQEYAGLFKEIKPDLVFNCAHIPIHGSLVDPPMLAAGNLGIPTATFIFSWDNLSTRSRILVPYDYYFVWNKIMRNELLSKYPSIKSANVYITGTPQFDFHFKSKFLISREKLSQIIGFNPQRPYILYTTGMASDFPEEHHHVESVIQFIKHTDIKPKPQIVVRTYIKGTSPEMLDLANQEHPDVFFPPILWEKEWATPKFDDLAIYSSLLHHSCMGINAASTVSLEMMMFNKPVINLGFDPPGSNLPNPMRWERHIEFDHYNPIAKSDATMVARSEAELWKMLQRGLEEPLADNEKQNQFLDQFFGSTLDGHSGERIAQKLIKLTTSTHDNSNL